MHRLFIAIYQLIQRSKLFAFILLILFVATAVFFASKLELSEDVSKLLPEKDIPLNLIENLDAIDFADRLFFHVELNDSSLTDPNALVLTADSIVAQVLRKQSDLIAEVHYKVNSASVDAVYDLILKYLPFYIDDADYTLIDDLIAEDNLNANFKKKYKSLFSPAAMFMRKMITNDPIGLSLEPLKRLQTFQFDSNFELYKNAIVTTDKKHLIFYIKPAFKSSDSKNNGDLIQGIDEIISKIQDQSQVDVEIDYFGAPAVAYANAKQIKRDVILTIIIAVLSIVILVALFYRRKRLFLIIFLPAILAVLVSMAILYLIKGEVSAIALGMGSILVGISIDYVLHIFTHAQNGRAVNQILKDVANPILISAFTTAAAFFGLLAISSGALQDMGLFAGISILFAALFSLILIPIFLPKQNKDGGKNSFKEALLPLFNFPFHEKKWLIIAILIISPVFYYFSRQVEFEGDLNKINYMSEKLTRAEAKLNEISSVSQRNVFLISRAKSLDSALIQAELMQYSLDSLSSSQGLDLMLARIQHLLPSKKLQSERLAKWNSFWTAEKKQVLMNNFANIKANYGFKADAFKNFENSLDKEYNSITDEDQKFINDNYLQELIKHNETGFTVLTQVKVGNNQRKKLHEALRKTSFSDAVMDKEYLATRFMNALKADFNLLVLLTMVIVFLIILIAFGRIELALITFLPMSISWIWTLGIMALFGVPFNIVNIVISTLIFGLGIDYSIFITKGLMEEYARGEKMLSSFKTSIFFSSLTTILGIGVLIFAKHPALKSMALVTVVGLLSVLLIAFTIQPWLFSFLINTKNKKRVSPITFTNSIGSLFAFIFFLLGTLISTLAGIFLLVLLPFKSEKKRFVFHKILQWNSKAMVYLMFHIPKKVIGNTKDKFEKPVIILSNHQSHIDIVLLLMLHPKMILLTNDWVQKNPFYGILVKLAHFYPVLDRLEENLPLIQQKLEKGYSVMVFPEGSRSPDSKIKRFHKGAFYIAEKLQIDILPIIMHGVGDCITKGENFLKAGRITVKVMDRIAPSDIRFGANYVERSKAFRQFYIGDLQALKLDEESTSYYRSKLVHNYKYKGPVLEWYTRIKTRLDKNYELFDELIPRDAKIVDLGCGYGYLALMLHFRSEKRKIIGVDFDADKIKVAQNVHAKSYSTEEQLHFELADVSTYKLADADVFILSDVLHYLPYEKQEILLSNCINHLNTGGKIIIRDGDSNHEKHRGTQFSEWQSTKLIGFNKTHSADKQLYFTSRKRLESFFSAINFNIEIIDRTKHNSNLIYIAKPKKV